jgi:hypothetical protein
VVPCTNLRSGNTKSCGCTLPPWLNGVEDDLSGQRFGRLTVLRRHVKVRRGWYWLCRCDCGAEKAILRANLTGGSRTTSCGCLVKDILQKRNHKHGLARRGSVSSEYHIWQGMLQRCFDEGNPAYSEYGGRGITVCERWVKSVECFIEDMGPRPGKEYSLDRKDNDGNYEPGNCKWSTRVEQANNRRPRRWAKKPANYLTTHRGGRAA